jgi:hypothetical protein
MTHLIYRACRYAGSAHSLISEDLLSQPVRTMACQLLMDSDSRSCLVLKCLSGPVFCGTLSRGTRNAVPGNRGEQR